MGENGQTEPEAEKLICTHMKYSLEVEACDKVVEFLWQEFEGKECPAHVTVSGNVGPVTASGNIFEEILKIVCKMMENGQTEPEAEKLICTHMKYSLEVEACDKVVEFLWQKFEGKECPAHVTVSGNVGPVTASGNIFEEILKIVCKMMENGQ